MLVNKEMSNISSVQILLASLRIIFSILVSRLFSNVTDFVD